MSAHPQGRILTAEDLTQGTEVECDVCVVGSGAGGAVAAHLLTERGLRVVLLEEGGYYTRRDFNQREEWAYPHLYQEMANRSTDDLSMSILQGRSVGGGTTVNWCVSFRTPERILSHWRDVHGVEGMTSQELGPHWDWLERRLRIAEWPPERNNRNNQLLWEGLGKLGWKRAQLRRNVNNCVNAGSCGVGCPVDAKQGMHATLIPDAVERGLTVYANTRALHIEWSGRRASAVHAEVLHPETNLPTGVRLTFRPRAVAVACGALNSPALLLRSGLEAEGRVGTRTWLHPVVVSSAVFDDPVEAYFGAPLSVWSDQFIERGPGRIGFFIETSPLQPLLASTVLSGIGAQHADTMRQLPHAATCIGISLDGLLPEEQGATVRLRKGSVGRLSIDYALGPKNWEALREAQKAMARIQLAAGARRVSTLHADPVVLERAEDVDRALDAAPFERNRVRVFTAHQMGGCSMGQDPAHSVVDSTLRFHDLDNLYVTDGSVLPTGLGVNPMQTILGVARVGASHLAASLG
ncbi:FAD-binding protein [Aggregicoccus sp. 17bor-14]|uniref:GMC family oxidoreductase n=1 Tax=Myxococcaceae TaxID=31 RepID=UPI00129C7F8B|nr:MULTISPECIES: GMC family oxidoreductase [Myxococcaceae]MBF5044607.1 GMC family oxidoreductase [Simulacricoccus sp. 17bor-14]MRI90351.1 FAD-binding protein [Aggregicoccus sp. 17bor-14]